MTAAFPDPEAPRPDDGVAVRTVVLGDLPLLVAGVGDVGRGPRLLAALEERGVVQVRTLAGADLPRGVRVGFMLGSAELRLADDRDDTLMRVPRVGLDDAWLTAARRLKGTMALFVRGEPLPPELPPAGLAAAVNDRAAAGAVIGAIIGFAEERLTLPLIF